MTDIHHEIKRRDKKLILEYMDEGNKMGISLFSAILLHQQKLPVFI